MGSGKSKKTPASGYRSLAGNGETVRIPTGEIATRFDRLDLTPAPSRFQMPSSSRALARMRPAQRRAATA